MNLIVHIPDEFAKRLGADRDLERTALEALALEAYRSDRLTKPELRRMLGFETRVELDGFLKEHGINDGMTVPEFEREQQALDRLSL